MAIVEPVSAAIWGAIKMGGRSTKSETVTQAESTDRRLVNDSGVVATEGANLSNTNTVNTTTNVLDAGAIKAATELVGKTIDANATGQNAAYAMAGDAIGGANKLAYAFGEGAVNVTQNLAKLTVGAVADTAGDAMAASVASAKAAAAAAADTSRAAIASNSENMRDVFAYSNGVNTHMAKTYDSAIGLVGNFSGRVMEALTGANKDNGAIAANAINQVNRAWDSAKTAEKDLAGGDYRQLMIIGAAIIGLVAIMGVKK